MPPKQTGNYHCLVEWTNVSAMWDVLLSPRDVKWVVPFKKESGDFSSRQTMSLTWFGTHREKQTKLWSGKFLVRFFKQFTLINVYLC